MRAIQLALLLSSLLSAVSVQAGDSTYAVTLAGKKCTESKTQRLECTYVVGKDLEFAIAGVGESDAGVHFLRSSYAGDYYASFGISHGCVIVQPGKKGAAPTSNQLFAFVSPKSGKVYSSWEECKGAS